MIRRSLAWAAGSVAVAVVLVGIGLLVPEYTAISVAVAALVLVVGMTIYEPAAMPILAMPAMVVVQRVGGDAVNLSLSDFALFGAFWFALFFTQRPLSRPMRSLLWLSAFYQVATLFTVIANPYTANTVEWFHAWLSVGGALLVGWAVGRAGRARLGLTLFMIPCLIIAALTCFTALQQLAAGNTGPVYLQIPFPMHKNFVGCVLGSAALLAYARPWWVGWPKAFTYPAFWLFGLAVLASQSRQALIGLAIGVVLITLRADPDRKRSKLILLAAIPAVYFVWAAVQEQLATNDQFNSAYQRLTWYEQAIDVWERSPWVGVGLRWWVANRTEYTFQPPNAELEVLTSAGIVGLVAFLVLFFGSLVVLWRLNPRFGTLAFSVLLMRFIQGQFDLFWVSVQVSVPFLIVGVCVGADAYAESRRAAREETGDTLPVDDLRSVEEMLDATGPTKHLVLTPSVIPAPQPEPTGRHRKDPTT
ncbi:O-antigen ligase family protein [Oerskovia paurometabola]|uniref:O-antigen ligase family protein n=1 Tax=Oerskovia paurometabola TaxID=162170 RepID=A0ABW1X479_9CELL|nr:O-antigen ligase family protein [Oerskovia paurometabola]MBM7498506.1 O-antigen ligase [Oerskovia paurometabola]